MWTDNHPFYFQANVFLKEVFGVQLEGNTPGNKILDKGSGTTKGTFDGSHALATGIEHLHEGITICYPSTLGSAFKVFATSTDGHPCVIYSDEPRRGRIVVDTGFTKMYTEFFNTTAGNDRYVRNVAVWLLAIDRRLKEGVPIKGNVY